jgi:hypothetical protein
MTAIIAENKEKMLKLREEDLTKAKEKIPDEKTKNEG